MKIRTFYRLENDVYSVSIYTQEARPILLVNYTCRKNPAYFGRRTHFGIRVFLDTGETKFFSGR